MKMPSTVASQTDRRLWLGVLVPTLGIVLICLALTISWLPQLPSEVAAQWNWTSGEVATLGPKWVTVLGLPGIAAVLVGALVALQWAGELARKHRRSYVGILTACALFIAGAAPVLLRDQVGLTDPTLAPDPSAQVLVLGIVSIVYGILCAIVAGGAAAKRATAESRP